MAVGSGGMDSWHRISVRIGVIGFFGGDRRAANESAKLQIVDLFIGALSDLVTPLKAGSTEIEFVQKPVTSWCYFQ